MNKPYNSHFWKSVHLLRGIAAILVVVHHIPQYLAGRINDVPTFERGAAGVDIFFAISGFVMYSSVKKSGHDWIGFLINRVSRILPLYWFCTIILGGSALLLPFLFKTFNTSWHTVYSSLLFLPIYNADGQIRPLLQMGWTLHYEIIFYLITGFCLIFSKRNAALIAAAILTAAAITLSALNIDTRGTPLILITPIIIEFLFGVLVAHIALNVQGKTYHTTTHPRIILATAALLIGFALVSASHAAGVGWERLAFWGTAGGLFLFSAISFENEIDRFLFKPLGGRTLGDISYSIYLTHGFALSISFKITSLLGLNSILIIGPILILASLAVGYLTHHFLETKLNGFFLRKMSSIFRR